MTKMWHDEIAEELIKVGVEQKLAEGIERLPENYLQMRSSDDGVDKLHILNSVEQTCLRLPCTHKKVDSG